MPTTATVGYNAAGTAGDYATMAAARAALSTMDIARPQYSNATKRRVWSEPFGIAAPFLSIDPLVGGLVFAMGGYYLPAVDTSAVTTQIYVKNLTIRAQNGGATNTVGSFGIYWGDVAPGNGLGIAVSNVRVIGGFIGFRVGSNVKANSCTFSNCFATGYGYGGANSSGFYFNVATKVYHCTAIGSGVASNFGFNFISTASTAVNCFAGDNPTDYGNTASMAVFSKCASTDTTGSEAGLRSLVVANLNFWKDASGAGSPFLTEENYRITTSSALYHAGTTNAGNPATDCDGNARDGSTPSIGWHEGTANAFGVSWSSETRVLAGNNFVSFAGSKTAALTLPSEKNVLTGSGLFGDSAAQKTPTLTLSAAGNTLSGSGTYGNPDTPVTPTLTLPAAAKVMADAGNFGNPGTPVTPTLPLAKVHQDQGGTLDLPALVKVAPSDTLEGSTGTMDLPALNKVAPSDTLEGATGTLDLPALSSVDPADTLEGAAGTLDLPALSSVDPLDTLKGATGTMDVPALAKVAPSDTLRGAAGTMDLPALSSVVPPDTLEGAEGTSDKLYSAAEEAERNTVPDLSLIPSPATGGPTAWLQLNVSRAGTLNLTELLALAYEEGYAAAEALFAAWEAVRNTLISAANVVKDVVIRQFGSDRLGTYETGVTLPATPTWGGALVPGDGQLTVPVVAATGEEANTIQVRYRLTPDGEPVVNPAFQRTGTGNIVVTGRTNEVLLGIDFYAISGSLVSLPAKERYKAPTAGTNAATGPLSLPAEYFKTLLAQSATWQAWCLAADAEAAKAHIYKVAVPGAGADVAAKRPFSLVDQGSKWDRAKIAGGARNYFDGSGDILWMIEAEVPTALAGDTLHDQAQDWFTNRVGAIVDEMIALAGSNGYLCVNAFRLQEGPSRNEKKTVKTEGDYFQAVYLVEWGI